MPDRRALADLWKGKPEEWLRSELAEATDVADEDGELDGYRRTRRYTRGASGDEYDG